MEKAKRIITGRKYKIEYLPGQFVEAKCVNGLGQYFQYLSPFITYERRYVTNFHGRSEVYKIN